VACGRWHEARSWIVGFRTSAPAMSPPPHSPDARAKAPFRRSLISDPEIQDAIGRGRSVPNFRPCPGARPTASADLISGDLDSTRLALRISVRVRDESQKAAHPRRHLDCAAVATSLVR